MSGVLKTRINGRSWIALILCLLALTFAVEAKLAWYLPHNSVDNEMQAAKALPSDARQTIQQGLPDHGPGYLLLSLTALLALLVQFRPATFSLNQIPTRNGSAVLESAFFSPGNFFRPPPVL